MQVMIAGLEAQPAPETARRWGPWRSGMFTKDFAVFDADSHVVEPPALWDKYLEPEYRALGKHALWRQEGRTGSYLKVNGEIFRDTTNPNLPRHALWRPGMNWDAIGALDPHTRHPMTEGASDPQARLADMDAMGVDQTLLYPSWFAEGFFLVRDPDVAYALARAYNDWIVDFCKAAPQRLFAAAILPLQNMDFALEELARVAQLPSVRAVFIRPMFVEDRYLNHPYYDPLWAELERLGITAAVHATPGLWNSEWTSHGPFFEKIKDRLVQPIAPGGGGGPFCRGCGREQYHLHPRHTTRPSAGADPGALARQPHVRRLDPDRFYRYGAVPGDEGRRGARQSILDAGSSRKDGSLDPGDPAFASLSGQHPVSTEPEEMWEHSN